jgi:hypothetical protein
VKAILIILICSFAPSASLLAQQPVNAKSRPKPPVNSPEPITLLALAGGVGAAGAVLSRRRRESVVSDNDE